MSGQVYFFGGWCSLTLFSHMWHLIGVALIQVNMVGPEVANLKECLPVFMCLSQHNLTRKDNLTGTKNPTNSLEAWKGLREIIVFLITHDGRPLKLLECGVLKLFQQQVFVHFKCASEYTELRSPPPLFFSRRKLILSSPLFKPPLPSPLLFFTNI